MDKKNFIFLFFRKKSFHFYHSPPGRLSDFVMRGVQAVIPESDWLGIREIVVKVSLKFRLWIKKNWTQNLFEQTSNDSRNIFFLHIMKIMNEKELFQVIRFISGFSNG